MWIRQKESAKCCLSILTELKKTRIRKILLIICIDNLKGFKKAIEAVHPQTKIQLCMVHMIRNSLKYVGCKDRKILSSDLKNIYQASREKEARLT